MMSHPARLRMNVRKRRLEVRDVERLDGADLLHVLGLLLDEDVDDVVDRDDAEELAVLGHDRHDVQVVLRHAARDVLLVHRRRDADRMLVRITSAIPLRRARR